MHDNQLTSADVRREAGNSGFTLIEILIAIVLVGILSAVAVVGISNLVNKGSKSACAASADAARAGSHAYYAANSTYPANFTQLTSAGVTGAPFTLPTGTTINGVVSVSPAVPTGVAVGLQASSGTTWYMTMTPGTVTTPPTFSCSP